MKAVSLLAVLPVASALTRPGNVGRLPALGWSSWNAYLCGISESTFLDTASALISKGFQAAGYEYINIDDCWSEMGGRDNITGQIIPNHDKFPNGISSLADKIHDMGFKLGIYSSAGLLTCAGYPASLGNEKLDAATFAGWGIDYLKYDNCGVPQSLNDPCISCNGDPDPQYYDQLDNGTCINKEGICPPGYDYSSTPTANRYRAMRDALVDQNRTILYSLCEWGTEDVWTWGNETGNSWRTTLDISTEFSKILEILNVNVFLSNYAGFTGHNDLDLLEIGNGGLTVAESRTHFAMWALNKSPLIISTPLDTLSDTNAQIMLNKHLLAFHQDPVHGGPARPYKWGVNPDWTFNETNPAEFWSGTGTKGTLVAMLNTLSQNRTMRADFAEVPQLNGQDKYTVVDAWTDESLGCVHGGVDLKVETHDTALLLVTPGC